MQNSQENICVWVSFLIKLQVLACNFIKKEILAQAFSCEICEISKDNFFTEHPWTTASVSGHFVITIRIKVEWKEQGL